MVRGRMRSASGTPVAAAVNRSCIDWSNVIDRLASASAIGQVRESNDEEGSFDRFGRKRIGGICAGDVVEQAAAEKGAVKTESGMVYRSLTDGKGASPKETDVVAHYKAHFDGKEFDSSYKRGQPTEFPLNRVIKCWTEGVQRMKVGGKAKLTCPPSLAYGDKGAGGTIPPNATLQFEVELLAIKPL